MSWDTPPPHQSQQLSVEPDSPLHNAPGSHMPTLDISSRPGSADPTAAQALTAENDLQSQPMTSTSSSSELVGGDPTDPSSAHAPYGTRSRGRNAAPRPNYAEDRDIDLDFETTNPQPKSSKHSNGSAFNSTANGSKDAGEKSTSNSRRAQPAMNGSNSAAKDSIPGTSSFSAKIDDGGPPGPTKKRKQPASAQNSTSTDGSASKRIFTTAPGLGQAQTESNMVTFDTHGAHLKDGKLTADDGSVYAANDHVYLICEPPGEPYYLARIMEFLPSKQSPSGPIEALRVNWFYRPRDIQRQAADTRVVFASMHSDTCPLASLRGKCQIKHLSEVTNLEEYRKQRDSFWFDKMFDRYIHRYYEVIPTSKVINVPGNVKKVLDERWKFVLVEIGKRKELTSAVKTCKRCCLYAASTDSVDCAVCHSTYHMHCVRPPLTRKPARGFAWACAPCSRAQERKLEARQTHAVGGSQPEAEEEVPEEEEDHPNGPANETSSDTPAPVGEDVPPRPATEEQIAQAKLWPYRYLGIHCQLEDALDYDDRIYPRASSRLGPRHQANVGEWPGRPVEYVKPVDIKKKYMRTSGGRKDGKLPKEAIVAIETAKQEKANRPKHVMDEPPGFVQRGEDEPVSIGGKHGRTSELLFKMPDSAQIPARGEDDAPNSDLSTADREKFIDDYMARAKEIAPEKGLEKHSTNFLDKALQVLYAESFNVEAALKRLRGFEKHTDFKEPHLRPEELKLFEQAVGKYGSELRNVTKHVKTVPHYQIVRFYYMWKKTPRGRQIWGTYEGRRGKKAARRSSGGGKLVDDVADDHDDSAFDAEKAADKKRGFICKFCSSRTSRQWRRAPGVVPGAKALSEPSSKRDKGYQLQIALCLRCALLWRKYGIQWEDIDEVVRKISQSGNKSLRRRVDEELLAQLLIASEDAADKNSAAAAATALSANAPAQALQQDIGRKKGRDKDSATTSTATSVEPAPRKKTGTEKAPEPPPIIPDPPRAKTLPCAVCDKMEPMSDHLSCRDCRLTVHRGCYGVKSSRNGAKWVCDMCSNDRNPMISTRYECVLCPVTWSEHELMESPKRTHKKKSDRDREKEKLEKEMIAEAVKLYRQRQECAGKPTSPREPLKRTVGNNWVHVTCAVWTPEIKFGNAEELEPAEGFGLVPAERHREVCKICKTNQGACVSCHFNGCNTRFHVGCASQARYPFGFDITPVKSTRRDAVSSVRIGDEVGSATSVIFCPHHNIGTVVHEIGELTGRQGLNALQLFCQTYKQADLTLTGTVRKAAHVQQSVGSSQHNATFGPRRASGANGVGPLLLGKEGHKTDGSPPRDETMFDSEPPSYSQPAIGTRIERKCCRCSTEFSPRWWPVGRTRRPTVLNGNGIHDSARFPGTSPQFHGRSLSQNSFTKPNGDYMLADRDAADGEPCSTAYECHKCHIKNPAPRVSPEPRPSPYSGQWPVLPAPRFSEYHGRPYGSHPHSTGPGMLPRPIGRPARTSPELPPGFDQRPGDYSNGMPVSGYHGPPVAPMNGYQPQPPVPGPPAPPAHYPAGTAVPVAPPPYPTHQSPYGPVPAPSRHPSHALGTRAYGSSVSSPDGHAGAARGSPPHSLSTLKGGPSPRVYAVDRVLSAPAQSPPASQVDTRRTPEDTPKSATTAGQANGASASPSLKNLLS